MEKLTASDLVGFIRELGTENSYKYIHKSTKSVFRIENVEGEEGPIKIRRAKSIGELSSSSIQSISQEMISRVVNAIQPEIPFNLDRILGASYNTRSALESILANTPEFYYCYPRRIEFKKDELTYKKGHKHLIWLPDNLPHPKGVITLFETNMVVSEVPAKDAYYPPLLPETGAIDIAIARRHSQIQLALYLIGHQLGFRTWIARNDHSIIYQNKKILDYQGVVQALKNEKLFTLQPEATEAAQLIDCIWFKNGNLIPAVIEVEHSTRINSGLLRMEKLRTHIQGYKVRYIIVAPDELREKVKKDANEVVFRELDTLFFPYSAVDELYTLCQRRKIRGITEEFLDCFMERMVIR